MASAPLPNYLLSHRKRLALSQDEVAFLMGTHGGSKVSRYECFVRVPSLETALAFEAIFQKPVRELFGGLSKRMEQQVAARAKILTYRKERGKPSGKSARKRQALSAMMALKTNPTVKP